MRTLMRFVRQLRKLNRVSWRVYQPRLEVPDNDRRNCFRNLSRSYMSMAAKPTISNIYNEKLFEKIENQLRNGERVDINDIQQLLLDIQTSGTVSNVDALMLIRSCGKPLIDADSKESIQLVQDVWDTLESLNIRIDVSHYNALLNVYLEKDHEISSAKFLSMMADRYVEPNRVTLQRLIAADCKQGDVAGATKILKQMKQKGLPLYEEIFNSLIIGHSQADDMTNALNTLRAMENAGISPSADTYTALMCAYAKRGDMDSIKATFGKIEKAGITLLETHYMEIIYALAANGHSSQAEELAARLPDEIDSDMDICRLLIKLINLNQLELALKLLKSSTKNPVRHKTRCRYITGALVKTGVKVEDVIRACEFMEKEKLYSHAFSSTVYDYLTTGTDSTTVIEIMKAWAKAGGEIRDHFFWPLLVTEAKANNIDGMFDVLTCMINDFKIIPSLSTLRDYTIPYMFGNIEDIIDRLTPLGIPRDNILTAIADRLLIERKLRNAAIMMTTFPTKYPKDLFIRHLVETLNVKDDVKSFSVIMRFLSNDSDPAKSDNSSTVADTVLREVMKVVPDYRPNVMISLLQELQVSGTSISTKTGDEVKKYLGDSVNIDVDELLLKLTSGTLVEVPLSQYNPYLARKYTEQKEPVSTIQVAELREAFNRNVVRRDAEGVAKTLNQLEAIGYISAPVLAQAIGIFCEQGNLEAAEKYMDTFSDKLPGSTLDLRKIVSFVELLIKNDRFNDAVVFLSRQPEAEGSIRFSRGFITIVQSLLETTLRCKDLQVTFQMIELLKVKKYLEPTIHLLGSLVTFCLNNNDIKTAVEIFERSIKEYDCAPSRNKLLVAIIQADDQVNLQKLTALSEKLHGKSNTKFILAVAYLNAGKRIQGKRILESPGLQIHDKPLQIAVDHLVKYNKLAELEELFEFTKNTTRLNRGIIYDGLLQMCIAKNDWERGLGLWTQMQEDDVILSSKFLNKLADLLTKNNKPVPYDRSDRHRRS
ncbi:leucine-rich PPR motif-containing protein, mitochondrial-like [Microplitis mediator]|uniref:leucine-rich PPR motif-containing protein, mitochondrial-like n=1 Tax=Microplitis mediator TaxID=375433 RepID=UPI0025567B58|nr:leucine-rich PPR motif-containing protein, mitochondrial-like [Microplitis mediator]XP_057333426.1 leucine-rich PPR motif-containing protein, mitochondrial-like [Microplitis mediator]XP_057333427.1 leucine-rich PPR motif-containing protein, mitochondrial-like [Microplitis mediator]XP_057333428.1 leucine-rich PPR motif-containing protein, mitochondrial-like [Microplitis mediator]XP_057333429.1 leucine-rich PPR motif-containing protein, mitochondrial-like [Microplitis mediator]XP_057333430.1 